MAQLAVKSNKNPKVNMLELECDPWKYVYQFPMGASVGIPSGCWNSKNDLVNAAQSIGQSI
jgi:hypothetical protein